MMTTRIISHAQIALDPILQFFAYDHLPAALKEASAPFYNLAAHVVASAPRGPERTVALRKLLEAKDAAVRACIGSMAGVASEDGGGIALPTFFDRLKTERSDLAEKLDKLSVFLVASPDALPAIQMELLQQQKTAMAEYLAVLDARIENIEHSEKRGGTLAGDRRPPMEGLEDGSAVREIGEADPVRDGPIKFGD